MSKVALVMENPKCCESCRLEFMGTCNGVSPRKSIVGTPKDLKEKPSWCPLVLVPEKKDKEKMRYDTDYNYALGFNACIDEICGKE